MKILATAAALTALVTGTTAEAQDAGKAFECNLPYRETMMAMGTLEVLRQSQVKGFVGLHGDGDMVEFVPGNTLVFGLKPTSLNLKVLPPHPTYDIQKDYAVEFTATFERSQGNDDALRRVAKWALDVCAEWTENCYRAEKATPEGAGDLTYIRVGDPQMRCTFSFTKEEFEALGE
jgi:hypothetical protein